MTAEHRQHTIIAILTDKADKTNAHLVHEFFLGYTQHLRLAAVTQQFHVEKEETKKERKNG